MPSVTRQHKMQACGVVAGAGLSNGLGRKDGVATFIDAVVYLHLAGSGAGVMVPKSKLPSALVWTGIYLLLNQ